MKKQTRIFVAALALIGLILGASESAWAAKKPLNSYFSGVKILMKEEYHQPDTALALLDSAILYHGHVPEAYKWMVVINSAIVEDISPKDLDARRERLGKMLESIEKLKSACENDDVKKKRRKKCEKYLKEAHAEEEKWYVEFVNDAQSEYLEIEEGLLEDLDDAEDDKEREEIQAEI
ncbi:MAG: hypothetical protein IIB00_04335, partial [candidate division Zixibacteria bacterium]|nr:hypothetical protein [candidate division Zixibacteria bacterium]